MFLGYEAAHTSHRHVNNARVEFKRKHTQKIKIRICFTIKTNIIHFVLSAGHSCHGKLLSPLQCCCNYESNCIVYLFLSEVHTDTQTHTPITRMLHRIWCAPLNSTMFNAKPWLIYNSCFAFVAIVIFTTKKTNRCDVLLLLLLSAKNCHWIAHSDNYLFAYLGADSWPGQPSTAIHHFRHFPFAVHFAGNWKVPTTLHTRCARAKVLLIEIYTPAKWMVDGYTIKHCAFISVYKRVKRKL